MRRAGLGQGSRSYPAEVSTGQIGRDCLHDPVAWRGVLKNSRLDWQVHLLRRISRSVFEQLQRWQLKQT